MSLYEGGIALLAYLAWYFALVTLTTRRDTIVLIYALISGLAVGFLAAVIA
jgi:hypothetical protein